MGDHLFCDGLKSDFKSDENENNDDLIASVTGQILQIHAKDKTLFNESDLIHLQDFAFVEAFARKCKNDTKKTVESIKNCLIWLKEKNFCKISRNNLPREYLEAGELFVEHGFDLKGNVVLYMRVKNGFNKNELEEFYERITALVFFNAAVNALSINTGFTLVFDLSHVALENINISLGYYLLKAATKLLPDSLRQILVYNISFVAKQITKVLVYALPWEFRKLLRYVDRDTISEYIAEENLPAFICDPNAEWKPSIPSECKNIDECDLEVIGIQKENKVTVKELFEKLKKKQALIHGKQAECSITNEIDPRSLHC